MVEEIQGIYSVYGRIGNPGFQIQWVTKFAKVYGIPLDRNIV